MKAYQCSTCECLKDLDETVTCQAGIDPRPNHREKNDAKTCKNNYKSLDEGKRWHAKFNWE